MNGYGPCQLEDFLGLATWQFARARAAKLIAAPDLARGRWSAEVAEAALARIAEITAAVGSIPDVGAFRAAGALSERLGITVTPAGVAELARRELIPQAGDYKGWTLYSGLAIETFTDAAVAELATCEGELRTADGSAAYLRIRRTDFDHLIRLGLLTPAEWGHGPFDSRRCCSVPLYRTGDLDQVAADGRIDWPSVRNTQSRCHSPLARLTRGDLAALTPMGETS
jgi:hypothetical protein